MKSRHSLASVFVYFTVQGMSVHVPMYVKDKTYVSMFRSLYVSYIHNLYPSIYTRVIWSLPIAFDSFYILFLYSFHLFHLLPYSNSRTFFESLCMESHDECVSFRLSNASCTCLYESRHFISRGNVDAIGRYAIENKSRFPTPQNKSTLLIYVGIRLTSAVNSCPASQCPGCHIHSTRIHAPRTIQEHTF